MLMCQTSLGLLSFPDVLIIANSKNLTNIRKIYLRGRQIGTTIFHSLVFSPNRALAKAWPHYG